jgi:hypothetical protein
MLRSVSYIVQRQMRKKDGTPHARGFQDWACPRATEEEARAVIASVQKNEIRRGIVGETGSDWRVVRVVETREILGEGRCEKRYLTTYEIRTLADEIEYREDGAALARHMRESKNHPTANGRCFEVSLTSAEAAVVDAACEHLKIGDN